MYYSGTTVRPVSISFGSGGGLFQFQNFKIHKRPTMYERLVKTGDALRLVRSEWASYGFLYSDDERAHELVEDE